MNICAFSRVNYWQGIKGGMDFHGRLLSEGLARLGHRVTIISSRHPEGILREQRNGVDIHYLPDTVFGSRRHGWAAKSVGKFRSLQRLAPFDLIWSQSFDAFGFTGHGKGLNRPPIVATLHGSIVQECKSFFSGVCTRDKNPVQFARGLAGLFFAYFICQKPLLSIADRVICVSAVVAEDIGRWFGHGYKAKCTVIENGVDVDFFAPDPEKGRLVRKRHGIPDGEPLILSLGRLTPAKGHQLAVYALKKLYERQLNARLLIAGQGEYLEALKDIVEKSGLNDRVIFTGFVTHDEAVAYYNAADIFVMPTLTIEGLPFVLLEAMSCGTPVIASQIGGNDSLLSDKVDGLLVEPGNIESLAENIGRLINDRGTRDALSGKARRKIVEKYSVDRMVARTLAVMESAVSSGRESNMGGLRI
ncbi:MAG: glycosyltransferase family 4 protein [Deltaproteobacteria bacterium]|nr:glycosyltransferase family 4 protein [Deltaproteobacteria bacterium]